MFLFDAPANGERLFAPPLNNYRHLRKYLLGSSNQRRLEVVREGGSKITAAGTYTLDNSEPPRFVNLGAANRLINRGKLIFFSGDREHSHYLHLPVPIKPMSPEQEAAEPYPGISWISGAARYQATAGTHRVGGAFRTLDEARAAREWGVSYMLDHPDHKGTLTQQYRRHLGG